MVLILGALHIDLDRTQGILQPDKTATQLQLWSQSCTAGLRSLEIDNHEVMQGLLHWERSLSTDSNLRSPPPHQVWPSLSDAEWIQVEVRLKDLILADYCPSTVGITFDTECAKR